MTTAWVTLNAVKESRFSKNEMLPLRFAQGFGSFHSA
jgi:hypothetical protein